MNLEEGNFNITQPNKHSIKVNDHLFKFVDQVQTKISEEIIFRIIGSFSTISESISTVFRSFKIKGGLKTFYPGQFGLVFSIKSLSNY